MDTITVLKELRERTDASLGACKEALEKAGGDLAKALAFLREEGGRIAQKRSTRETGSGVVEAYIHVTRKVGALLEMRSETDFVSRHADFQSLAHDIAMHIAASNPADVSALLAQPFIKDESKTVGDLMTEAIARFGENIQIPRFSRFEL